MKIVFLDRGSIGPGLELTRPSFDHEWQEFLHTDPTNLIEHAIDADIIISNKAPIRAEKINMLPKLKMIAVTATGYDAFDVDACKKKGIVVSNVRDYASSTVPEHTFALILALRRNIAGYRNEVIGGAWQKSKQFCFFTHPIQDLAGTTLGIIGAGTLGQRVAAIGKCFGMQIKFAERKSATEVRNGYYSFEEVLETSDILTLHCPLTDTTKNLIARSEFERMARAPLLVNCSRGGLVNEHDLVWALDHNIIAGAGFDCLSTEPPASDNPILSILDRTNVIVTPHVAWASEQAMQYLWDQVIENIQNFYDGTPSNRIA